MRKVMKKMEVTKKKSDHQTKIVYQRMKQQKYLHPR